MPLYNNNCMPELELELHGEGYRYAPLLRGSCPADGSGPTAQAMRGVDGQQIGTAIAAVLTVLRT